MREINLLSVQQWLRSAISDSQQLISPIGFLFLKLPPPPCAVLLVLTYLYLYLYLYRFLFIYQTYIYRLGNGLGCFTECSEIPLQSENLSKQRRTYFLQESEAEWQSFGVWGTCFAIVAACLIHLFSPISIWLAGKKRIPGLQVAGAAQLQQQKLIDNLNFPKIWNQIGRYWL